MNPPYCRNLHLKILNEAVKHSDDVVCIHPARWLEDVFFGGGTGKRRHMSEKLYIVK